VSDRVVIPLPGIGTLVLHVEVYRDGLEEGAKLFPPAASVGARTTESDEPLMNAAEIARAVNVPKTCIYERAKRGDIPAVKVGKHWRFRRTDVLAALGGTS